MQQPKISYSDKKVEYDFIDIKISSVEYSGKNGSGMTLIYSPTYMSFYVSKRGKDIGGICIDNENHDNSIDSGTKAICLVGGSNLGLEAVCGVSRAFLKRDKIHETPIGACCYTLNLLRYKDKKIRHYNKNIQFPDINLGLFAFANLNNNPIPVGYCGAGLNTAVSKIGSNWIKNYVEGGQGAHFIKYERIKILCIIILNSIGLIHENGKLLYKWKEYTHLDEIKNIKKYNELFLGKNNNYPKNTTLTVLITNVKLNKNEREKYAEKFHDIVENMIYPYGTKYDGDVFILSSTEKINIEDKNQLYKLGKECIKKAIYSVFV